MFASLYIALLPSSKPISFFAVLNGQNPSQLTKYGPIIPYDSSSSVSAWFSDGIDEFPSSSEDEDDHHQDQAMSPRANALAEKQAKKKKEQEAKEEAALRRANARNKNQTTVRKVNGKKTPPSSANKARPSPKSGGGKLKNPP